MWWSVDPLAEQFPGWTPYHYVHNNPINLTDLTGMSAVDGEYHDKQGGVFYNSQGAVPVNININNNPNNNGRSGRKVPNVNE